jgi:hypothetical protein
MVRLVFQILTWSDIAWIRVLCIRHIPKQVQIKLNQKYIDYIYIYIYILINISKYVYVSGTDII